MKYISNKFVCFAFQDAHNAILKYDTNSSLFAVYDGHGGHEVAKYSAQHLPDFIKNNEDYRKGNIDKVNTNKIKIMSFKKFFTNTQIDVTLTIKFVILK